MKKLLIDGDISRYELGAVCQTNESHFGTVVVRPHSEAKVREVVDRFVNGVIDRTDCDGFELFLSAGTNYRNDIAVTNPYKGQRTAAKPYHWRTVGEILQSDYGAIMVHGAEADDALSIFARRDPEHTIIGSRDKDLRIVPCFHYSWRCGEAQPEIPVHFVEEMGWIEARPYNSGGWKLVGEGLKFFYGQVLVGDAIDNYKGCPRVGPVAAYEALVNCETEEEMYEAVLRLYTKKLGPEKGYELLLENAQLAWLLEKGEVKHDANSIHISPIRLWLPPGARLPDDEQRGVLPWEESPEPTGPIAEIRSEESSEGDGADSTGWLPICDRWGSSS